MLLVTSALMPAVVLAAAVVASEPRPEAEPPANPGAGERTATVKEELRPSQSPATERRPPVRVILPSPYRAPR
jgi:hypothetical protein